METTKIKELADAYAAGKVEELMNNAIADAYSDGFIAQVRSYL